MTAPAPAETLLPVVFDVPLVNPSPNGLFAAVSWTDETAPLRWLPGGVDFRNGFNYGGKFSFGIWEADWCAQPGDLTPDDIKTGVRPGDPGVFKALTVWAYDECDPTDRSQTEVRARVQQVLRLEEQVAVERELSAELATLLSPTTEADLVAAVGALEGALAVTNTVGVIHASAVLAAVAANNNLLRFTAAGPVTPMGHKWVFGGGYVEGLGPDLLVATSPLYGWRSAPELRDGLRERETTYFAIAERSILVGYEKAVAAVTIDPTP